MGAGVGGVRVQTFNVVFSLLQNGFQKRAHIVQIAPKLLMPGYRFFVPPPRVRTRVFLCDPDLTSSHVQPHTYIYAYADTRTQHNCCLKTTAIKQAN